MYKQTLLSAVMLMLVACASNTDCKFQPGVNVEAQDIEKIQKEGIKDTVQVTPKGNVTCNF